MMYTIGIDIGGTNLRIGIVDENGVAALTESVPQAGVLAGNAKDGLTDFISSYIGKHGLSGRVAGICAAFPAAIDRDRAVVLNAPNVKGFDGVDVRALLRERLGYPAFVEKDVNALLTCDLRRYKVDTYSVVIGCYIGTGLGNAICVHGRLLTGHNGVAGELGHIPAWDVEEACSCGNKGCVETFVGGKYLDRLRREQYAGTPIGLLFAHHGGETPLRAYIRRLAGVIAAEINILDPETVIIGGGVPSMEAFPSGLLEEYIRSYARKPLPEANLKFILSENLPENGVIGAGMTAWENIKNLCKK